MGSSSWLQKKNKTQKQSKQQPKQVQEMENSTWGHWNQQAGPPRVGAAGDFEQLCPTVTTPHPGLSYKACCVLRGQGRDCTYSETHTAVKMNKLEPGLPMKEGRRHVNTQHDTLPAVQEAHHPACFQGTQM